MTKLSNSYLLSVATKLLLLLVVAKLISLGVYSFLPSDGVELQEDTNYAQNYQRIDFKNMLGSQSSQKTVARTSKVSGIGIKNMLLKGLYSVGSDGFAIVALKSSAKKTSIISIGESFSGYKLKTILSNSVVFTKGSKKYILEIAYTKDIAQKQKKIVKKVLPVLETKDVSRSDIMVYAKKPSAIWKDIGITELKEGNAIKGFEVTRIKQGSKMAELGLKRGDIIIKANNVELKSYKDALAIYKNLNKLSAIQIVVLRDNIEKELIYEIH